MNPCDFEWEKILFKQSNGLTNVIWTLLKRGRTNTEDVPENIKKGHENVF